MQLRFLGHSAFEVKSSGGQTILIDPYLDGNPLAAVKSDQITADFIVVTHAHGDHLGDALKIARRCGSLLICVYELGSYLASKGFQTHNMHIGGAHDFAFGRAKLTIAWHGSQTPEGQYAGPAAGVMLWVDGSCIYHTGDTGLFYDMKLIGELNRVDYLLLPIGDNYTMGIDDAVKAVELVRPRVAIPMHYNTFGLIEADPEVFADKVRALGRECLVLQPGDTV